MNRGDGERDVQQAPFKRTPQALCAPVRPRWNGWCFCVTAVCRVTRSLPLHSRVAQDKINWQVLLRSILNMDEQLKNISMWKLWHRIRHDIQGVCLNLKVHIHTLDFTYFYFRYLSACTCTTYVHGTCEGQKRASGSQELDLQVVVSCHLGAGGTEPGYPLQGSKRS